MTRRWLVVASAVLMAASMPAAQQAPSAPAVKQPQPARPRAPRPSPGAAAEAAIRPLVERYFVAWSTRNPDRAASLYAPDPALVFYDLTGAPHVGWESYKKARTEFFTEFSSVQLAPDPGFLVRSTGTTMAWTAAGFRGTAVDKNREVLRLEGRHTAVWEKRGADWVIVHEHLSIPFENVAALRERYRPKPPQISEADSRAAVTKIFQEYQQAWNVGNAAALAGLWQETGDIVTLGAGGATRGRAAVTTMWGEVMARRTSTFSTAIDVRVDDLRLIGDDVALVDGTFDYWRVGADRSGGVPAAQERFTSVLTASQGQWGIASIRVAVIPSKPPVTTKPKR